MIENYAKCFGTSPIEIVRKATHQGLYFRGLPYQSSLLRLHLVICRTQDRVRLLVNPEDLSHCYIPDEDGEGFLAIPCLYRHYAAGLSVRTHVQVMRLFLPFDRRPTEDQLLQARRSLEKKPSRVGPPARHIHRSSARPFIQPDRPGRIAGTPDQRDVERYTAMMANIAANLSRIDKNVDEEDGE